MWSRVSRDPVQHIAIACFLPLLLSLGKRDFRGRVEGVEDTDGAPNEFPATSC